MTSDQEWMRLALSEARAASDAGEVPVGAVLVKHGVLVATGRNSPLASHDPSSHAELNALRAGGAVLGNYRLDDCELFVTLEPCAMCAGAMLHARLARVVFGAADPKTGVAGSVLDLFGQPQLNHRTQVDGGVLASECRDLLLAFFRDRRKAARAAAAPLRDDALRTPVDRFDALADAMFTPHYVSDLPALHGWRMHYVDESPPTASHVFLCLHGPGEWSYFFRHLPMVQQGLRVLAPDLIGFGLSDKPKRESLHRLAWHCEVLLQWFDRLQLGPLTLVHSAAGEPLASLLIHAAPERFAAMYQAPDDGEDVIDAWRAPFPDRGHEAALRALGPICDQVSGPSAASAAALARTAMGYSGP